MDACSNFEKEFSFLESNCNQQDVLLFYMNLYNNIKSIFDFVLENKLLIVLFIITIFVIFAWYKMYWTHIVVKKELIDIGFDHIPPGPHRNRKISRALAARRASSQVPPPYPNGWFAVTESDVLKIGSVIAVDVLGQNLCVYRGEDGVARCVDAYCPHLGANLAIGGSVCGNCIECPFHKWRFDEDGACVSVSGAEHAPKGVSIKKWRTVETNRFVWIWYDVEDRDSLWTLADVVPKSMKLRGRNEFIMNSHVQDTAENVADLSHLRTIHSYPLIPSLGKKYPFLDHILGRHEVSGTWRKGDDHTAALVLSYHFSIFKCKILHRNVTIVQDGPGHSHFLFRSLTGSVQVSMSATPLSPNLLRVVHHVFAPWYNTPMAAIIMATLRKMFEGDIEVLNSRRFVPMPAYAAIDKSIREYRTWFAQFYSDKSISYRDATQNNLDW